MCLIHFSIPIVVSHFSSPLLERQTASAPEMISISSLVI